MPPATPRSSRFAPRIARILLFTGSTFAQTLPPQLTTSTPDTPAHEAVVELSPFVTSSSPEAGRVATETLAGGRLRTDFKDVLNQIETLTKNFMQDLGLASLDQALVYTANVENSMDYIPGTTAAGSTSGDWTMTDVNGRPYPDQTHAHTHYPSHL